jgi:hypothetical protein
MILVMSSEVETSVEISVSERTRDSSTSLGMTMGSGSVYRGIESTITLVRFLAVARSDKGRAGSVYQGAQNAMTNDECPMMKECSNDECRSPRVLTSSFELRDSFVIRHSSFVI